MTVTRRDRFFVLMVVIGMIAFICFLFYIVHCVTKFDNECRQRGGVPMHIRDSGAYCFDPHAIIEVPK